MKRRAFLKTTSASALGMAVGSQELNASNIQQSNSDRILNAYYFRAHMYTMVPRQIREDMKWMAGLGTNTVTVALLEQDLFAAVENINYIAEEAQREGISLFIVPSRWGGLTAGAPKVPSLFSVLNPQTWILRENGQPYIAAKTSGVLSSIHYKETYDFFVETLKQAFQYWPVKGVIWDEPKAYGKIDYSPKAQEVMKGKNNVKDHNDAFSNFFSSVNAAIKVMDQNISTHLFIQAHKGHLLESASKITDLDYLGCDGTPWNAEEDQLLGKHGKYLFNQMDAFFEAAKSSGKKTLVLAENHNMEHKKTAYIEKNLPKVIAAKPDHLIYYYYPRNVEKPGDQMGVIGKVLGKYW